MSGLLWLVASAWGVTHTVTVYTDTVPPVAGELRHYLSVAAPGDSIVFAGSGTIALTAPLPVIGSPLDGLTLDGGGDVGIDASGANGSALVIDGADGVAIVGLTIGSSDSHGIEVRSSSNVTLGGDGILANAIVDHDRSGIFIDAMSSSVTVRRNRVGLTFSNAPSGNCAALATGCAAIRVQRGATGVAIDYNVVGANHGHGVATEAHGTSLFGNRIGTDTTGVADHGNAGDGVLVSGLGLLPTTGVIVDNNVVVGNDGHGIHVAAWAAGTTVTSNYVGLTTSLLTLGNDGDGVHVAGGAGHVVGGALAGDGNRIGANGGSGLYAAATLLDAGLTALTVDGNLIGVEPGGTSDLGNAGYGIYLSLPVDPAATPADTHTLGSASMGNTIGGNDLGGVYLSAANVDLRGNRIGTDEAGVAAIANGTVGSTAAFGVKIVVPQGTDDRPIVVDGNLVSANHGHGVWVTRDPFLPGGALPRPVDLIDNVIGTSADTLTALGNTSDGLRIAGVDGVMVVDNLIAHSAGDGVAVVSGKWGGSASSTELATNTLRDNAGHGLRLGELGQSGAVTASLAQANTIDANGGAGIYSTAGATGNELTQNVVVGNGQCAVLDVGLADTAGLVSAPYATSVTGGGISGTIDALGATVDRIEVFERATGAFIGSVPGAAVVASSWQLVGAPPAGVLGPDDVSALAILASGTTSEMTKYEGDGCVPASCTPVGDEEEGCQIWWLDPATGCESVLRPERYRCDDGDHLTGMINHVLDPDESWLYQDACDPYGNCIEGTDLTDTGLLAAPGDACPWKTACNKATVQPLGCTYEAIDYNNECGIDDYFCDGLCSPGALGICAECSGELMANDINLNSIPDEWELAAFDHDCDTATPLADPIGEGLTTAVTAGDTPIYVFVATMDMALNTHPVTGALLHPGSVHSHHLDPTVLGQIQQTFAAQGHTLIVEQVAIPHYTLVSDVRQNYDPDCNDVYDFAMLDDIKARHFPPSKRGSYHFMLMAHHDAPLATPSTPSTSSAPAGTATRARAR